MRLVELLATRRQLAVNRRQDLLRPLGRLQAKPKWGNTPSAREDMTMIGARGAHNPTTARPTCRRGALPFPEALRSNRRFTGGLCRDLMANSALLTRKGGDMAFPTAVNDQITDAVTQANVKVLGDAPGIALGNLYQATSQALSIAAH
ncbi:MAG TPA: RebB family R body protein, partial [Myxococcaceae bacterium]